jgi:hypothetical protein
VLLWSLRQRNAVWRLHVHLRVHEAHNAGLAAVIVTIRRHESLRPEPQTHIRRQPCQCHISAALDVAQAVVCFDNGLQRRNTDAQANVGLHFATVNDAFADPLERTDNLAVNDARQRIVLIGRQLVARLVAVV